MMPDMWNDDISMLVFLQNKTSRKNNQMPAKSSDFTRITFSDHQQPTFSYHFLSPETTLRPYDEIHFLNNWFSTHVFVKCSTAVLGF